MYENNPNKIYSDQEIMSVATKTLNYLVANWGVDCRLEFSATRRSNCYYQKTRPTPRIVIGLPCVREFMKRGDSYDNKTKLHWRGLNQVVETIIHEYAHAIVEDLGLFVRGDVHGYDFWDYYWKLIKDAVKDL